LKVPERGEGWKGFNRRWRRVSQISGSLSEGKERNEVRSLTADGADRALRIADFGLQITEDREKRESGWKIHRSKQGRRRLRRRIIFNRRLHIHAKAGQGFSQISGSLSEGKEGTKFGFSRLLVFA